MASDIDHEAYSTIALSRPVLYLFPNLISLNVVVQFPPSRNLPHLSLFLCEGLRRLTISTPRAVRIGDGLDYGGESEEEIDLVSVDITSWSFFFADVLRSPHIEHLTLTPMWDPRVIDQTLSSFLESLQDLRTLTIYDALLTSQVVSVLSRCPRLEVVQGHSLIPPISKPEDTNILMSYDDSDESVESDVEEPFSPVFLPPAFPVLRALSLRANITDITTFVNSAFFPSSSLTSLCIHAPHQEACCNIKSFFVSLAERCMGLIRVVFRIPEAEVVRLYLSGLYRFRTELEFVDFDAIEPLCALSNLRLFTLNTLYPLSLNDEEIRQMARAWPELEELDLNHHPSPAFNPLQRLTLAGIASFAELCPNLCTLRLHILPELDYDSFLEPPTPFQKLENLVVSILDRRYDTWGVAAFLADILPPKCSLTRRCYQEGKLFRHLNGFGGPMDRYWIMESEQSWRDVELAVPRMREREREDRWFGPKWKEILAMSNNEISDF